ncbi:MAG: molybdenum cofactor biosynthesis protein MoaE [Desulfurococcales archaeon]|uniref:Molybdenum cofactor biosynthesis protein MoaE n=1 Tax=Fervidicoccus fontis TaxID=683846 RepID=A0A7J3SM29_9CREN
MILVKLAESDDELVLENIIEKMKMTDESFEIGGMAFFLGLVKGTLEDGGKVFELEYDSIRAAAEESLKKIAEEEKEKWGLKAIAILHRIGKLRPGERTLLVVVSGRGRKEIFPALEEVVERVKKEVPIFKLERREDGEYWIVGDKKRVRRNRK